MTKVYPPIFLLILLLVATPNVLAQQKSLFLLIGQSNMAGRGDYESLEDTLLIQNVFILNEKGVFEPAKNPLNRYSTIRKTNNPDLQKIGIGQTFASGISEALQDSVYLIVNAKGGTHIEKFLKGGDHAYYESIVNRTKNALKNNPELSLDAILWHQGESNSGNPSNYLENLRTLIEDLRTDFDLPNLPVIVGQLGMWRDHYSEIRGLIRTIPSQIPNTFLVSSEGLTNKDKAHFDTKSYKEFGKRYANIYLKEKYLTHKILQRLEPAFQLPIEPDKIPRSLEEDGTMRLVKGRDWCSGFFPGVLWYTYELSGRKDFKQLAAKWTRLIEDQKTNAGTHDMGFKISSSFGNAYQITKDPYYREVILESAKTLATRYNEKVGSIRSWDHHQDKWSFPVIIDNMMNLELLFNATQLSGDSTYYKIAYKHANTTLKNHFRADNSSFHVVDYNPTTGKVQSKATHQGLKDSSAWARGQAWGLYGFTMAYRFTGDKKFLNQALKIYDFIFNNPNLPDDLVPYWDYNVDTSGNPPRDASAAAIAASALYELAGYTGDEMMIAKADKIIEILGSDAYLAKANAKHVFILDHSTGNKNRDDEVDTPIIYADYYFLEALLRKRREQQGSKVIKKEENVIINKQEQ
ncbi:sialate O-acetylesterase [Gramella sp. AN32]|uniref:Sialate O-acetylesterase n=1 Tax=Christiangramia antarctica TaxID=2058158 RepID=A0ABW5X2Z1_9FLAO|nr:sialate O-acetylesterase [Gramella sp. AN32]